MNRIATISLAALLLPAALGAQEEGIEASTAVEVGVAQVDVDTDSSKFNEYRDRRNGFFLFDLRFDLLDNRNGRYLELRGTDVSRDDQSIGLRAGRFGRWALDVDWDETPHLLSNKAQTPFIDRGDGLFVVPATVPITFKKLATSGPDAPGVLASDALIAAFLEDTLHPVALGTQRDRGTARLEYQGLEALDLGLIYTSDRRSGSKVGYGPIGDRPPRTLNVQLAEPVDFHTQDVTFQADLAREHYQVGFSYLYSAFENENDIFTWQNLFATPQPGADFDVWDRAVSAFGRRPLSPDNSFQSANLTFGIEAPLEGRLTATAAYGILEQDETLLPYSFAESILVDPTLPRATADAEMNTTHLNVAYTFNPASRVNVNAFYRSYDLDNETPQDRWWYVTQDTSNLNGTRSFKNKRVNLAYEYDTQNLGADALVRLGFWRSTLGLGYEREEIGRSFREADTSEDKVKLQWRARPSDRLSLRLGYRFGDRAAEGFDGFVNQASYWYAPAEAGTDQDNPQFTFTNHPDMVRHDVSDRERHQLDLVATLTGGELYVLSANARYRTDNFDSDVRPTQPLLGTGLPDEAAATPGDQLGLLDDDRWQVGLDAFFTPSAPLSWNVFVNYEQAESLQRSLEFNENNKQNPSAVATAELGPWTRAGSQWTADFDDRVTVLGLGATYVVTPDRVTLRLDSSASRGEIDIDYGGFGVTNFDGTPFPDNHQFAFRTPPTVRHHQYVADLSLELRVSPDLDLTVGYLYDRYTIRDWQQEDNTPWFESVGSEFLLRDTSRSHQWGNRLVNLGSFLAPGYDASYGYVTLGYRF
jgi:MtrB/PioB family decaheme-associated outer membrane protein